jgi:hypothetical protein
MRRRVPLTIAFVFGVVMVVTFFTPPLSTTIRQDLTEWLQIVFAFALLMASTGLILMHLRRVMARREGWFFNLVALVGAIATIAVGVVWIVNGNETAMQWLFTNVFIPVEATMFALLAFFMASAAYRAFRARSGQATVLLVAAVIVMLGRVSVGPYITNWLPESLSFLHIPDFAGWIMDVPNMATKRAIMIGVGLGMISTAIKVILGIERSYLGGEE